MLIMQGMGKQQHPSASSRIPVPYDKELRQSRQAWRALPYENSGGKIGTCPYLAGVHSFCVKYTIALKIISHYQAKQVCKLGY
jgi:hypothetical protein